MQEMPVQKSSLSRWLVVLLAFSMIACDRAEQATMQSARTLEHFTLKLAETWGPNYPIFGEATKRLSAMVDRMSAGRLKITIDSSNKHKAPFGILDMVKAGQYDIGHSASYYWKGKDPNTLYFTSMPFSMTAPEQLAWFYHGGGMELMEKVYRRHGVLSFPGGNTGSQMAGWFRKEIRSLDDLQGLKIRIPGFAGEVLARLGAKPTNIPPGELYTALERNTIDAVEWVGPSLDLRMGFHKIAPYYYTGWHEPGTELQFLVNRGSWDRLPPDLQEVLRVAMRATAYDMYIHAYHESARNWAEMTAQYPDIRVMTFPGPVLDAMRHANEQLLAEHAKADPLAKEIIDSQADYLATAREWTAISDLAYLNSLDR
jgi:TRAP-type mannitol/chloroaromatic compound transport system substrate-binding protein